jgi:hypothetical protein
MKDKEFKENYKRMKEERVKTPETGGYPTTDVKESGVEKRGTGAQTKSTKMRGPVA